MASIKTFHLHKVIPCEEGYWDGNIIIHIIDNWGSSREGRTKNLPITGTPDLKRTFRDIYLLNIVNLFIIPLIHHHLHFAAKGNIHIHLIILHYYRIIIVFLLICWILIYWLNVVSAMMGHLTSTVVCEIIDVKSVCIIIYCQPEVPVCANLYQFTLERDLFFRITSHQ